ncbi:long-chain fatty acid--CoA ligase [Ectothiorhodospiraceae bacterium WFHF3C12]|nr:long-chain fatty acid--CoA ligase [Ectothiorhodospiraceae bacterium WFHF3C12]
MSEKQPTSRFGARPGAPHLKFWPKHAPYSLTLPRTSIYENLAISARRYPDKAAVVYYGSTLTYRQLRDEADRLAGYLMQDLGVAQGDFVLLYMQNSPQWIVAYYAILRANAVVIPVNPMNRTDELRHYVDDTRARVVICGQELWDQARPLMGEGDLANAVVASYGDYVTEPTDLTVPDAVAEPRRAVSGAGAAAWNEVLALGREPGPHVVGPDDYAVFPYSSGTTGAPKGCMHTHRSAMATIVGGTIWNPVSASGVVLATLPFFHVTGLQTSMNGSIFVGATIVLMSRWDRDTALELIQRYRVTHWRNIATMAVDFLSHPRIGDYDLSSLRGIGGGGAAMPEAIENKLYELTGLRYVEGYGLSETIAATHVNPPDRPKAQCLGVPVFDVDSRVLEVEGTAELDPGEVGEIVISAPQVFRGYWNRPEETAEAFVEIDGKAFFRTGDMGYVDEEGYFFLVDRVKRMINASGYKVWPAEVESLMYAHPDIQEVCVIASPDPRRGETVKAVVVPKAGAADRVTEDDILAWCRDHMSAYKVPRSVAFVDELPRSASGKLLWRVLQDRERGGAH